MAQFHWDPAGYLELIRSEVPDYEALQDATAAATGHAASRILELGTGTGETARRVLERHPQAVLVGLDASGAMLDRARSVLPAERVELRVSSMEDVLPAGAFDLVFSTLAVHHLDGPGKADLFRRVSETLTARGRFVLGDVVVPEDPDDFVTPIDGEHDTPSSISEQLAWLTRAGLEPALAWAHRDLAVLVGRSRSEPTRTGTQAPDAEEVPRR